jgi:hypothetical protein
MRRAFCDAIIARLARFHIAVCRQCRLPQLCWFCKAGNRTGLNLTVSRASKAPSYLRRTARRKTSQASLHLSNRDRNFLLSG